MCATQHGSRLLRSSMLASAHALVHNGPMPTRFSHQIRYPAPLDQVGEMLDDKAFRERVCREQLVLRHRVAISDQPRGLEVLVERVHSTDPMPTAARKLLGPGQ